MHEIVTIFDTLSAEVPFHRIHGDCHFGNLLNGSEGLYVLDCDDFLNGPAVQDVWMLVPARDQEGLRQRDVFLDAYRTFREFDPAWLRLVEPLRSLRYIRYRTVLDGAFGSSLVVGAQNAHGEDQGAFTGEVSCALLGTMGVRFVILGHSERRTLFGETDDAVRVKVRAALRHGLVPLVCVGETEAERDAGRTLEVVRRQVLAALDFDAARGSDAIVVAYEPVWAIGTGRVAAAAQIVEAHRAIRSDLGDAVGRDRASDTRIL